MHTVRSMRIKLIVEEIELLRSLTLKESARGGFQNLLLQIWYRLDEDTGEVDLPFLLLERIHRYGFQYNSPSFRKTLRRLFRRTLGVNLDRGFLTAGSAEDGA